MIILLLLKDQDMYGYQMVQELNSRTGGVMTAKEGALYSVLYVLFNAGYVTEHKVMVKERRFRIVKAKPCRDPDDSARLFCLK